MFYLCLQTRSKLHFALPHHKHCDVFAVVMLRSMSRAATCVIGNQISSFIHHAVIAKSRKCLRKNRGVVPQTFCIRECVTGVVFNGHASK